MPTLNKTVSLNKAMATVLTSSKEQAIECKECGGYYLIPKNIDRPAYWCDECHEKDKIKYNSKSS